VFIHTLEKERRTCLSFLVFGEILSSQPRDIFTAKDAEDAKGKQEGIYAMPVPIRSDYATFASFGL
jgi:hypothetical protein